MILADLRVENVGDLLMVAISIVLRQKASCKTCQTLSPRYRHAGFFTGLDQSRTRCSREHHYFPMSSTRLVPSIDTFFPSEL